MKTLIDFVLRKRACPYPKNVLNPLKLSIQCHVLTERIMLIIFKCHERTFDMTSKNISSKHEDFFMENCGGRNVHLVFNCSVQ